LPGLSHIAFFLGKTVRDLIYRLYRRRTFGSLLPHFVVGQRSEGMLQKSANQDVFTVHRPSPWPYVGALMAASALITTLVVTFSS
jgi:hypothetical protein